MSDARTTARHSDPERAPESRDARSQRSGEHVLTRLLHEIATGALAGAAVGAVVGGLGSRVAMRVSALASDSGLQGTLTENDNVVGEISVGGTFALLIFGGILFGAGGGLFYAAVRRWLADLGRWRGLAFGVLLLAILGNAVVDGDNADFRRFGPAGLNVAMFSSLYILFGVLVVPLHDRVQRAVPTLSTSTHPLAALAVALGLLLALGIVLPVVFSGFGGGPARRFLLTALPLYLLLGLPLLAALLERRVGRFERLSDIKQHPRLMLLAVAALIPPVAAGLALDARALVEILSA